MTITAAEILARADREYAEDIKSGRGPAIRVRGRDRWGPRMPVEQYYADFNAAAERVPFNPDPPGDPFPCATGSSHDDLKRIGAWLERNDEKEPVMKTPRISISTVGQAQVLTIEYVDEVKNQAEVDAPSGNGFFITEENMNILREFGDKKKHDLISSYGRGFFNGIELCLATMTGRDVKFEDPSPQEEVEAEVEAEVLTKAEQAGYDTLKPMSSDRSTWKADAAVWSQEFSASAKRLLSMGAKSSTTLLDATPGSWLFAWFANALQAGRTAGIAEVRSKPKAKFGNVTTLELISEIEARIRLRSDGIGDIRIVLGGLLALFRQFFASFMRKHPDAKLDERTVDLD